MKKMICAMLSVALSTSIAFADIIDPGWPPQPRPIPAPHPEPVDDGEVVVIKVLLVAMVIVVITSLHFVKKQKAIKNA